MLRLLKIKNQPFSGFFFFSGENCAFFSSKPCATIIFWVLLNHYPYPSEQKLYFITSSVYPFRYAGVMQLSFVRQTLAGLNNFSKQFLSGKVALWVFSTVAPPFAGSIYSLFIECDYSLAMLSQKGLFHFTKQKHLSFSLQRLGALISKQDIFLKGSFYGK